MAALAILGPAARANVMTWDFNSSGGTADGSGVWNNSSRNWWGSGADNVWNAANTAQFGSSAGSNPYTVTLGAAVSAYGINFASQNYTIAGGGNTLTINGGGITANTSATISAPIAFAATQTWTVSSGTLTIGGNVYGGNCGLDTSGTGAIVLGGYGNNSIALVAINNGSLQLASSNTFGGLSGSGNLVLAGSGGSPVTLTLNDFLSTVFSGTITGNGTISKTGNYQLTLACPLPSTAGLQVAAGTVLLGSSPVLQNQVPVVNSPATLAFASGVTSAAMGGLSGNGNCSLCDTLSHSATLTLGGNNASSTFAGIMSGRGSLVKSGTGLLMLSNESSFTGATVVNGGTLALDFGNGSGPSRSPTRRACRSSRGPLSASTHSSRSAFRNCPAW